MAATLVTGFLFVLGFLSVADQRPGTAFCFVVAGSLVAICLQ
jgi:hypothetical protein